MKVLIGILLLMLPVQNNFFEFLTTIGRDEERVRENKNFPFFSTFEKPKSETSFYSKALKLGSYAALGTSLAVGTVAGGLYMAGFGTLGIIKGSLAAGWMAAKGGLVAKGSLLALTQSLTTSSVGLTTIYGGSAVIGAGVSSALGVFGLGSKEDKK